LKARAWLDLQARKNAGALIDSQVINKHKRDVFRLYRVITPRQKIDAPERIQIDMNLFLQAMAQEEIDLGILGIKGISKQVVLDELTALY
jgi:hypothetical protein